MVRRVQDPAPEDPESLSSHVEERHHFQPPRFVTSGHAFQTRATQLLITPAKRRGHKLLRQQRGRFGLARQSDELSKEAPFRKKLVLHDVEHAAGTLHRFESHIFWFELAPYADHLAGLAGIRV